MMRKIIKIDEDKCTGCGLCAEACHEGAIGMVNGKAKLLRDDYCDGLGDCLPAIIKNNSIKSVTVVRMEVPCCGGIESAVKKALQNSGEMISWQVITISTDGKILD